MQTKLRITDVFEFYVSLVDFGRGVHGEPAGSGDDVRNLDGFVGNGHDAGDALIDVSVSGENRVGIETCGGASCIKGIA